MRYLARSKFLLLVLAAVAAAACAHNKAATAAPPTEPVAAAPAPKAEGPVAAPRAVPAACANDSQCTSKELCLDGACTAISPSLAACGLARVHFDYDADILAPAEYPVLQRAARCIEANDPAHVLITGNADERGTVEYNLALGQRRAAAVRKYLAQLGVSSGNLDAVSYGKEMPLCSEHDEACWKQNRRSAIKPGEVAEDLSARIKADEAAEKASRK